MKTRQTLYTLLLVCGGYLVSAHAEVLAFPAAETETSVTVGQDDDTKAQTQTEEKKKKKKKKSGVMTREDIELSGCNNIECVLRSMSGITIVNGSIRIRSTTNSLNGPSDPIAVVDGIVMDISMINTIALQDVSEIRVLKDASEYGVRGSNGAIIIKTGR